MKFWRFCLILSLLLMLMQLLTVDTELTSAQSSQISFVSSTLQNGVVENPTSLQFGPDGRLYIALQDGTIKVFTIQRHSATHYAVTHTEVITIIKNMPNYDDNGALNTTLGKRQVTGLMVTGTAASPVIYVASSDPRIAVHTDSNLDTNSGVISRLTRSGSNWTKLDLVRGLPRNEENHASNGMVLDAVTNILYVAQGGHTNLGAPSNAFDFQPEYALSGAILSINLNLINVMPVKVDSQGQSYLYNLPTLNDPSRPDANGQDAGDPWGGNDGANQAMLVPGGPVQVYSPGYRTAYDLVRFPDGRMYTVDNGGNQDWGGIPTGEGPDGNCTNEPNELQSASVPDNLHFISGPGYYGGHPNAFRGNMNNKINGQSPVYVSNPVECDFRKPVPQPWAAGDTSLAVFPASTNGMVIYTASSFNNAMKGDILAASFDGNVYRMKLNAAGNALVDLVPTLPQAYQSLFSGFGAVPLDITAQGDGQVFPGTVWVANYASFNIAVFEPVGYSNCSGANNAMLDEDQDGYNNADEIANGTNSCSAGSVPPDNDRDFQSDLQDTDDDNDATPDLSDPFQIDAANGKNTLIPLEYTWAIGNPGFGFFGLGFTGMMSNGTTDYRTLYNAANMTAGGASGQLTVDAVPPGDALGSSNNQAYAFQFGVNAASTGRFTVHTSIESPYFGSNPKNHQSVGMYIGTGNQDNYLKIALAANNGAGGIEIVHEINGAMQSTMHTIPNILSARNVNLYLSVNPVTGQVQPKYSLANNAPTSIGNAFTVPTSWFNGGNALAVGVIATSRGATPFPATWDGIDIALDTSTNEARYRVNAGGPMVASTNGSQPNWSADSNEDPSSYSNYPSGGVYTFTTGTAIDTTHASIPAGVPMAIFQSERWDFPGGSEMTWNFPVTPGIYQVRLYFAEIYNGVNAPGQRVFDVSIENALVLDNYDVYARAGGLYKGIVETFTVSSDDLLNIAFGHVVDNPAIKAIEIIPTNDPVQVPTATPTATNTPIPGPTIIAVSPVWPTPSSTPMPASTLMPLMPGLVPPVFANMNGGAPDWIAETPWTLVSDTDPADLYWSIGTASTPASLTWTAAIDLGMVENPKLSFASWMSSSVSMGMVQISPDMTNWTSVGYVTASETWSPVTMNLAEYGGQVVYLRFVWLTPPDAQGDIWRVDDVLVEGDGKLPPVVATLPVQIVPVTPEMPPLPGVEIPPLVIVPVEPVMASPAPPMETPLAPAPQS